MNKFAVPTEPFSSKSNNLIEKEKQADNGQQYQYPWIIITNDDRDKVGPYVLFEAHITTWAANSANAKHPVTGEDLDGSSEYGYRWIYLFAMDPKTLRKRVFLSAPYLRPRIAAVQRAFDNNLEREECVYDWFTVRNCFSSVLPDHPRRDHVRLINASERIWKLFWDPESDTNESVLKTFATITDCMSRVSSLDKEKHIFDAEEILANTEKYRKWRVVT